MFWTMQWLYVTETENWFSLYCFFYFWLAVYCFFYFWLVVYCFFFHRCVIDPNARIISQSTQETRFYFQYFEFSTNRDSLYLHCNATFCKSNDYSANCEQSCHHKRLGGGNIVFDGPTDAVAVNEAVRLTNGVQFTFFIKIRFIDH